MKTVAAPDKVNILVVDDLPENLLVMGAVLEDLHENVITARSGAEALQLILQFDFAVILLDVNMPDMDGYETAAYIRRRKKSSLTPIIFITAYADEIHKAQGYSLGAVDYLLSPVVPDIVRTKVRVFVELFRMTQEVKRSADERVALAQMQVARSAAEAAQAAAEEASRRSAFLAEISTDLAGLLDFEATARKLASRSLPFLADFAAVRIPGELGAGGLTELAWLDPSFQGRVATGSGLEILPAWLIDSGERVLASRKMEFLDDFSRAKDEAKSKTVEASESLATSPDRNGDLTSISSSLRFVVILPLQVRQEVIGVLVLAMGASGRRFGPVEIELAENLAARAAVFLENARLYQQIKDADRRKNEFLSMLAHELRNPMAPIQNATEILNALQAPGEELQWVRGVIDRNVKQLARLVTDLLDISRITQGKIRLHLEPVGVAAIVEQAVEISRPLIDSRNHHLSISLPGEPICVNGDATRLAQAVANLLNNAAKYTETGGRIELKVTKDQNQVVLSIRDSGIGISPDMLPKIFELFTQIDRSLDRSQGGLGIGLSLVRSIVEMHQGVVQAFSAGLGKGSAFVVRLPLLTQSGPAVSDQSSQVFPPSKIPNSNGADGQASGLSPLQVRRAGRRILVVDDNQDSTESLARLLRLGGHQVETALDGTTGLKVARDYRPEVIFLDLGLPEMDGYEIARRLRQDRNLAKVALIAMTGYGQEEDRRKSQETGFDGYMVKPADPVHVAKLLAGFPLTYFDR
jgi:signal transduction histidine kinase